MNHPSVVGRSHERKPEVAFCFDGREGGDLVIGAGGTEADRAGTS
jgi:hypothetical protein